MYVSQFPSPWGGYPLPVEDLKLCAGRGCCRCPLHHLLAASALEVTPLPVQCRPHPLVDSPLVLFALPLHSWFISDFSSLAFILIPHSLPGTLFTSHIL